MLFVFQSHLVVLQRLQLPHLKRYDIMLQVQIVEFPFVHSTKDKYFIL